MSKPPQMSARARLHRHRKSLAFGTLLIGFVLLIGVAGWFLMRAGGETDAATQLAGALFLMVFAGGSLGVVGFVLLTVGLLGERKANKVNRVDWALAERLANHCEALLQEPPHIAYVAENVQEFTPHRLIEVERHFDERTAGDARGAAMHQFSMFGSAVSVSQAEGKKSALTVGGFSGAVRGLSDLHLTLAATTRRDLMGDALFALFETRGSGGQPDTLRVTALSNGAVRDWMQTLVHQTANTFGMDTHSGVTISAYADRIVAHFAPSDVSYLSDRLHLVASQTARGDQATPLVIRGIPSGRGAIVATSAQIDGPDQGSLRVFPTRFPALWGNRVGTAIAGDGPRAELSA